MKNPTTLPPQKNKVAPFKVKQALVGLESVDAGKSILRYLDFFTQNIPTASTLFLHVEPYAENYINLQTDEYIDLQVEFLQEDAKNDLENKIQKYFPKREKRKFKIELEEGSPLEKLLESAEKFKADLVVIGQKKGTKHHGILAKSFARKVKGNALIIPEKSKPKINKILVPVDFSENSGRALQAAVAIQKELSGSVKLIALNVYQLPTMSSYHITRSRAKFKSMVKENIKIAFDNFLEKYVPEEKDLIEAKLLFKDTPNMAGYIYSYASKNKIDFMLVGAKGHSRVELLLMGSVTEKLLSLNRTFPTLVIK